MSAGSNSNDTTAIEDHNGSAKKNKTPEEKRIRLEREATELMAAVNGRNVSKLKNRVAAILNLYPDTRNSDITLALKFWEVFQPDVYSTSSFHPRDMFRLERYINIVRARQK